MSKSFSAARIVTCLRRCSKSERFAYESGWCCGAFAVEVTVMDFGGGLRDGKAQIGFAPRQ